MNCILSKQAYSGIMRLGLMSRPAVSLFRSAAAYKTRWACPSTTASFSSSARMSEAMKALIYASPQTPRLVETKKPTIQNPTDAIVKLVHSSVCGTDLHILNGDVPTAKPGLIMGHEGVGKIIEMGSAVDGFNVGDNVLISCVTSCGVCSACRKGMSSHCRTGGWILGNGINGTQAEYVRIPHATSSLYRLPADMDLRAAVILSDALPTAMECGTTNADVKPGSSVVIIGAGPVGLAVLLTAKLLTPAKLAVVDLDDFRLAQAKDMGADETFNPSKPGTTEAIMASTEGQGFDCVIEAVGISKTFEQAQSLLAPGGNLANVGVHGVKTDLHLEKLWDRNISIHTRLVDAVSTPSLLNLSSKGKINMAQLISHKFPFSEIENAYSYFKSAAENKALKIIIDF